MRAPHLVKEAVTPLATNKYVVDVTFFVVMGSEM
jgi:hypothetical protein